MRLALAVFLAALLTPLVLADSSSCDSVSTCLEIGDVNCRVPGRTCHAGAFCQRTNDHSTGICTAAARITERCSSTAFDNVVCYDPTYPTAIFCKDDFVDGNGTCVFGALYGPGESCSNETQFDDAGACIYGECGSDLLCSSINSGAACNTSEFAIAECAPGLYCNQIDHTCADRQAIGSNCTQSVECDYDLVCTRRGLSLIAPICQARWIQSEGQGCDSNFDCSAGLYCGENAQCIKASKYHNDLCNEDDFCQHGWDCQCEIEYEGDKQIELGGRCTNNLEITKEYIKAFNGLQSCLKKDVCQDYFWHETHASGIAPIGPNQCLQKCLEESKFAVDLIKPIEEGKCFQGSFADILAPISALLIVVLVAAML